MKIGIIGSGQVGQSLGKGLSEAGHEVMVGTRSPEKLKGFLEANRTVRIGMSLEAAGYGEVVILAIKGTVVDEVLPSLKQQLAGKVVIDVTNPLVFSDSGEPGLSVGHNNSGGEIVQRLLPDSKVVKTLNIINHAHMIRPMYEDGTPIMFVAGDDANAKGQVSDLLRSLGWQDIVDLGGIDKSRLLESLCLLWVQYGVIRDTWSHAVAVLKK